MILIPKNSNLRLLIIFLSLSIVFLLYLPYKSFERSLINAPVNINAETNTKITNILNLPGGYMAVTTIIKNEAVYLSEWLEFHRLLGVDLFIIFDDGSEDYPENTLRSFIEEGILVLLNAIEVLPTSCSRKARSSMHPHCHCQEAAIEYARQLVKGKYRWFAAFDVDEFLWVPKNQGSTMPSLKETLQTNFEDFDVININSTVWGDNNIISKQKMEGPLVIESFLKRANTNISSDAFLYNDRFGHKSIVNPDRVQKAMIHFPICFNCKIIQLATLRPDLRMNHYQYKSKEDQLEKARKQGNSMYDISPDRSKIMNEIFDDSILYLLDPLRKSMYYRKNNQKPFPVKNFSLDFDYSLFELHDVSDNKPYNYTPDMCVVFLSCKRLELLKRSIGSFIRYMKQEEKTLMRSFFGTMPVIMK